MYEISSLLRSILDRNNASNVTLTEEISNMTEDEKRDMFLLQKTIISQYRQESYNELQRKKETMQCLIEKSRNLGIAIDESDVGIPPVDLQTSSITNIVYKVASVPNRSRLNGISPVLATQSNKQINLNKEPKIQKKAKKQLDSPNKQYKPITPACFVAIDNKLKQINFELRALTRKQQMISHKLKK